MKKIYIVIFIIVFAIGFKAGDYESEGKYKHLATNTEIPFDSEFYGIFNDGNLNKVVEVEKGTKSDRVFKNELKEIILKSGLLENNERV